MSKESVTCIICPVGCQMEVNVENGIVASVKDNACKRGESYACQECVSPMRMVTAVAPVAGSDMPVSLRTASPIPKAMIVQCMRTIDRLVLSAPIFAGQMIMENIAGTGVALIATKDIR
jgi:CxxC motif-containing protein